MFKVLDVGSGAHPKGDVNVDLYVTPQERKSQRFVTSTKITEFFVKADAHYLPFKNAIFEKVICYHTLEHLLNPYVVLTEIFRLLKPNGHLILDLPNARLLNHEHPSHFYSWTQYSIPNLLKHAGFKVEKVTVNIKRINMQITSRK